MFDLIGQAFINLGNLIQQTTTGSTELDSVVSIILAIAAIAGVIGTFIKQVNKDSKLGQYMDTFSQKTVENEEMLRRVGAAVTDTIPEIKDPLKKYGADLLYLEDRVEKGQRQLELMRDLALKQKERAAAVDMPREKQTVF